MYKILLLTVFSVLCLSAAAHAADVVVTEADMRFSDEAIKIKAGDTVLFKNADTVMHNIQVINGDGASDDKGLQKPDETIKLSFAKPGEYKVYCGIHPAMKLKVSVQ